MDLTQAYPRSPSARLGGLVWLPRLIDKARAKLTNTLGEYIYNCPTDARFFEFTGISPEAFLVAVKGTYDDTGVLAWVKARAKSWADAEIKSFNEMMASRGPSSPESQKHFDETLARIAPGRAGIRTWFMLIDAEEGRV
jgi:hypothetical protein